MTPTHALRQIEHTLAGYTDLPEDIRNKIDECLEVLWDKILLGD